MTVFLSAYATASSRATLFGRVTAYSRFVPTAGDDAHPTSSIEVSSVMNCDRINGILGGMRRRRQRCRAVASATGERCAAPFARPSLMVGVIDGKQTRREGEPFSLAYLTGSYFCEGIPVDVTTRVCACAVVILPIPGSVTSSPPRQPTLHQGAPAV
jgi:hypothetical protein